MYQLLKDPRTNEACAVLVVGTNMSIPLDEANSDYQMYLVWVAEGNTAEEWNPE